MWCNGRLRTVLASLFPVRVCVSSEHVHRAIEAEANKDGNTRKLAIAEADERHLFVYIDPQNYLPWKALVGGHPPQQGPSLPSEITYAWTVARTPSADEFVVWKGERGKNWQLSRFSGSTSNPRKRSN
jgi:hypothetical protein